MDTFVRHRCFFYIFAYMRTRIQWVAAALAAILTACAPGQATDGDRGLPSDQSSDKTTFQTSRRWSPFLDNRADAVMVYGVGGNPS